MEWSKISHTGIQDKLYAASKSKKIAYAHLFLLLAFSFSRTVIQCVSADDDLFIACKTLRIIVPLST